MASDERDYSHRSLLEKLGVMPEHRVCARGTGEDFLREINAVLEREATPNLNGDYDLIFLHVNAPADLVRIPALARHLKPNGGLWVFHPKGKDASPSDSAVRAAGLAVGLVDNKICAYSKTHTATRYVIRRKNR